MATALKKSNQVDYNSLQSSSFIGPMKKMKYLLFKTHQQKSKLLHDPTQSQYLNAIKQQAIKSLQDFQQNCLNQAQLNLTLTSERPASQYRSLSDQKQNMRKTFHSKHSSNKTPSSTTAGPNFDTSSLNIRKLLRIKTEVEQKRQVNKLRNPFYKIQKVREVNKKFSLTNQQQQFIIRQNKSLCLKEEKKTKILNVSKDHLVKQSEANQKEKIFISRDKKQWYFASRKFRSRTLQEVQTVGADKSRGQSGKKMFQPLQASQKVEENKKEMDFEGGERQSSEMNELEKLQVFELGFGGKAGERQEKEGDNEGWQWLRERSLTVKYNEIKDYFEKKYNKPNADEDENDGNEGYEEAKVSEFE